MDKKPGWMLAAALLTVTSHAFAQVSPAQPPASSEQTQNRRTSQAPTDLEPAVDTSAPAASSPSQNESSATSAPSETQTRPAEPRAASGGARSRGASGNRGASDRIELDATQITGNRELPKVMYIVPWKRSDLGDLVGKPVNSLLDEVLAPVDRDVFRRQNRYYQALSSEQPAAGAAAAQPATQAAQPEK